MPEEPPKPTSAERRRNLDAYLNARERGTDAGLSDLEGRNDPDALALRMHLLVQAGRDQEAADAVRGLPLHGSWCNEAVHALIQLGDTGRAREIVDWAQQEFKEPARWQTCRAAFAQSALSALPRLAKRGGTADEVQPGSVNDAQKALLEEAVEVLQPAVRMIAASGRVNNELESAVLITALKCDYLLRRQEACRENFRLLAARRPIPLFLAQLLRNDWLELSLPADFAKRLRAEHPDSLEAKIYAASVDALIPGNENAAFDAAYALIPEKGTPAERRQLAALLIDLRPHLQGTEKERCEQVLPALLQEAGSDSFTVLANADLALRGGEVERAAGILDGRRDEADVHWLQLRGECFALAGDKEAAGKLFRQASELVPSPSLLRRAVDAAFANNDLDGAREILKRLAALEPGDVKVLSNLAALAAKADQMPEAARYYAELRGLRPDDPQYLFNEAKCLARAGELEAAQERFDLLCQKPGWLERDAATGRAEVLKARNDPEGAFRSLEQVRAKFWGETEFVSAYLNAAFMSGHEDRGHEALVQILELQKAGAPQVMEAVSLDTLKERMSVRGEVIRDAHQDVLQGKLPWLLADSLSGNVPYAAVAFRTQPLDWLGDDPPSRERFGVYATDAFVYRPEHLTDRARPLAFAIMQCPAPGTPVVVDQTALITLHRLELLDQCADYFGKVFFPIGYLAQVLEDSNALVLHQKSRSDNLILIRRAVDQRQIEVVGEDAGLTRIDEYENTENEPSRPPVYRLRDVIDLLAAEGKISDADEAESLKVFHQDALAQPGEANALRVNQFVSVSLTTLMSITDAKLLGTLIETLNVRLTPADRDLLNAETRAAEHRQEIYRQHIRLWETIQNDDRFSEANVTIPEAFEDAENTRETARYLSSALLAGQKKVALMADDRVLLKMAAHEKLDAFSTDRFLLAIGQNEKLPWDDVAEKFLTLARWRYKFLVPAPEIMLTLAKRYRKHPPGKPLWEMAVYLQDCMRDAGLPVGYADATPGSSLAHTFFYKLTTMAGEFAVDVWADAAFEPEAANALMQWIAQSLLPAAPKYMRDGRTTLLIAQSARIMMSAAFIRAAKIQDFQHANQALRSIAAALALSDGEYEKILTGLLHGN